MQAIDVFRLMTVATAVIVMTGCGDSDDLTAADLAAAKGVHWWVLDAPSGHEDVVFGVRVVTEEGIQEQSGGMSDWSGGRAKVMVWNLDEQRLRYAVIGDAATLSGNIANPIPPGHDTRMFTPSGEHVEAGDLVLVAGKDSATRPPEGDQVGLAFGFRKKETD